MSLQSRLQRATQSLSPLQRAVLVLQAVKEGKEPDPELRRIDDAMQRRAFNRYMALLWVANHHLSAIASITAYRVEVAEQDASYFHMLNEAAGLIEEENGLEPSKASRKWRSKPVVTAPEFLRGLALERKDDAVARIEHLWKETLALEAARAELAQDFAGEDIILPEVSERHIETQERLQAAAKKVGIRKLATAPDEEMLRICQDTVEESFRHLGYSEV